MTATGVAADSSPIPLDGTPNLAYEATNNRITTSGYQYDATGNQTRALNKDGSWLKYEFDAANRLQVVKRDSDGATLQAFQYGSTNARLMDMDYGYGYLKIFASVGGTTLAEYTEFAGAVPTWTKSYNYLGDSVLSTISNVSGSEVTEFNHPDRLGTRVITNQAAGTSSEQTTLPFGTALNAESTVSLTKRFTSYERSNQTGLDYAINRTYDSKQGRFTQVDPIGMSAVGLASPQTLNLYTYCGNDPINHVDPDGLFFGKLFKWIVKIVKIVAAALLAVAAVLAFSLGDVWSGVQLAMQSAQLWADISGNKVLQRIVAIASIAVSIYRIQTQPPTITPTFPFAGGAGGSVGIDPNYLFIFTGVGAIANSFAQTKDNKRKKRYSSAQQAAIAFLMRVNPRSIRINREIAAFICKLKNGKFITGKDQVLGPSGGSPINDCPKDSQLAGIAHTHARWDPNFVKNGIDYNEIFSASDKSWNVPNWVATPSGDIHRWNPDTGLIATISKLPGVGRTRRR